MRPFFSLRVAHWWGCGCPLARLLASHNQDPPSGTDYLAPLKPKKLSYLWRADQLVFYGTKSPDVFPESLGFSGASYQRFYLHYRSVRPDPARPYVYQVSGSGRQVRGQRLANLRGRAGRQRRLPRNPPGPGRGKRTVVELVALSL